LHRCRCLLLLLLRPSTWSYQPVTPGEAAGLSPREGIVAELARNGSHRQEYVLKDVVAKGVAFHHAGLTADERELVERAYWSGVWGPAATTHMCCLWICQE
jgi:hypothetical protein